MVRAVSDRRFKSNQGSLGMDRTRLEFFFLTILFIAIFSLVKP